MYACASRGSGRQIPPYPLQEGVEALEAEAGCPKLASYPNAVRV